MCQVTYSLLDLIIIKITDVLGNVILKEVIASSKKLDVTELKSGVYFIVFEGNGVKSFSRKVIIRH